MSVRFLSLLILVVSNTYGQTTLEARIENLRNGTVYLQNTTTNHIDSLAVDNYTFSYKTYLIEPTMFYIKFKGYNDWNCPLRVILSSSPTAMKLNELKRAGEGTWQSLYPNTLSFPTDPNLNNQFFQFEAAWKTFSDTIMSLMPEQAPNMLLEKRKKLYHEFIQSSDTFVMNYSNKIVSAVVIYEYLIRNGLIDATKSKQLFDQLDDAVKSSIAGKKIEAYINKELSKAAPRLQFHDSNDNERNPSKQ